VNELEQAVNHHVVDEEEEMLPLAREALGSVRLGAVGSAYESAKAKALG
jgi:hypothetical protein